MDEDRRHPDRSATTSTAKTDVVDDVELAVVSREPSDSYQAFASSSQPRVVRYLSNRFSKLTSQSKRIYCLIRGPQTPIVLPGPVPWLDRQYNWKRLNFTISLERHVIKGTRIFTKWWLLWPFCAAYIIGLAFIVRANSFITPAESFIGCTSTYWIQDAGCGLDGEACLPFDNSTFEFRCPSQCKSVILQNPRAVGAEEPVFVPLVVGGGNDLTNASSHTYRGDSFLCAAAVHAGLIDDNKGGCATVSLTGNHTNFLSSTANGITSTPFPSIFPLSFQLSPATNLHQCTDLRNDALAYNILMTAILFLVLRPPPIVLYWCLVCVGFWHITFFSEPRTFPPPISDAFGTFLPTLFVAYAFWRLAWRYVLPHFSSMPIERMIWYLGAFWAGVLYNLVTAGIPVDRLVASDIRERPGALVSLIIIIVIVLILVLNQARLIRKTGFLFTYAKWYIAVGLVILIGSQLPGLQFRLHHYFAAILLMPITYLPTRLSAIYQAFILGFFLNGVAAFDFASIFQTTLELVRDGALGTDRPTFVTNSSTWNASKGLNQSVLWSPIPNDGNGWDAFSLMVDDVERLASNTLNYSLSVLQEGIPHFFRLAFVSNGVSGDYTKAATLFPNGTWIDPLPGAAA